MNRALIASLSVALLLVPGVRASTTAGITVYAAASLTEVLPRIDRNPSYSFGGSNQLALQIRQGAPADVFASAAPNFTQELFRDGLVEKPVTFASNKLVLAVPKSNPAGIESIFDLRRKSVRLVIGTPRVPVGVYTRQVLRNLGMTRVLSKVVSQEPDAKSIVGKVALGEADAGFVYRTDVRPVSDRLSAISIPARAQPKVRYEVAVVRASRNRAGARRFVQALTKERARRLFVQAGFGVK